MTGEDQRLSTDPEPYDVVPWLIVLFGLFAAGSIVVATIQATFADVPAFEREQRVRDARDADAIASCRINENRLRAMRSAPALAAGDVACPPPPASRRR